MITLILGADKIRVDTIDIGTVSLNYSLKDIKNYGKRNISYSKPITVLKTLQTEKVFQSLFNINIVNGYTISDMIDGELQENGVAILKGSIQVIEIRSDSYDIVITSAEFNLFNEMGDKLIKGNKDTSNDITFDASEYHHSCTRDFIRTQLTSDPSNNGKGYMYPIIDYDNEINTPEDITSDYILLPAIAARELFDGIFTKYGYTYELSDDISSYINKMYIPLNDDINNYLTPIDSSGNFAKYLIGTVQNEENRYCDPPYDKYVEYSDSTNPIIKNILQGYEVSTGGYDYFYDRAPGYSNNDYQLKGYIIPKNGEYKIDVNLLYGMWFGEFGGPHEIESTGWYYTDSADQKANLCIIRDNNISRIYTIGIATAVSFPPYCNHTFITNSFDDLDLRKGDGVVIVHERISESGEMDIVRCASSNFTITEKQSFFANDNVFDLNAMRPLNYKQADFFNDILKIFNCYIEIDEDNNKKMYIKSYNNYFENISKKDWTNKLDKKNIKRTSLKNEFPKQISFKYSKGNDIFNQDYDSKYIQSFGSNLVHNDSDFSTEKKEVNLSISPTIFKTIKSKYSG